MAYKCRKYYFSMRTRTYSSTIMHATVAAILYITRTYVYSTVQAHGPAYHECSEVLQAHDTPRHAVGVCVHPCTAQRHAISASMRPQDAQTEQDVVQQLVAARRQRS
jgi:hypothetical protein